MLRMSVVSVAAMVLALVIPARATTYTYLGGPGILTVFNSDSGCFPGACLVGPVLQGSVTFNFDSSHFTGLHALSDGDTGILEGPAANFLFPDTTVWYNPPYDTYGSYSDLSGQFTFVNGQITSWSIMGGYNGEIGCGAGPGCVYGVSFSSSPTQETYTSSIYMSGLDFEGTGGGAWTESASAVPEAATWIMMIAGFLGLGFRAYRRGMIQTVAASPSRCEQN